MVANRASRKGLACMLLAAWLLLAGPVLALGLGQIQVKSKPGEPLLAEIPVVAGDPSELRNLQVRLASPETFRRVGLQPPDVAGTGLQLSVGVDGRGRPVIRVTSEVPLQQPVLAFLVEVDWGSGRLVREYSAVLDAPTAIAAPAQQVQAPTVARPDTIERRPLPVPQPAPAQVEALPPEPPAPQPAPVAPPKPAAQPEAPAPARPPDQPRQPAAAVASRPSPAAARTPAPAPAATPQATPQAYTVQAGDTLSEIAQDMRRGNHSLDQAMVALLRSNPEAFIGGNINRLRAGAVLRMPAADELSRYSAGEAASLVREQVAEWRAASAPTQAQPQARPEAVPAVDGARPEAAPPAAAIASGEARLEIVPPSAEGEAGSGSGIQAGGEGEMLRQAQETEALAARDAEIGELRARIAELEKIQQKQQALIEMKDSALATAQDDLASARQQAPASTSGSGWWIAGGLLLVLLAVGAWLALRKPAPPRRPRVFVEPPPGSEPGPALRDPE